MVWKVLEWFNELISSFKTYNLKNNIFQLDDFVYMKGYDCLVIKGFNITLISIIQLPLDPPLHSDHWR